MGAVLKVGADLLVCPAVGTGARVLVHETLTVLAANLRPLLGGYWHRLRLGHPITGHRLTVACTHRHPVPRIGIVRGSWPVTTVTLLNWISTWLRHIARHSLWHAAGWDEGDLCLTAHVRSAFAFYNGLETILYCGSTPRRAAGRYSNAEWESLSRSFTKVAWPRDLNISGEENILHPVHFLNSLVVDGHPNGLFETLENPGFKLDSVTLNVLVSIHVNFSDHRFALLESCFVEGDPDFTLWGYEMIE